MNTKWSWRQANWSAWSILGFEGFIRRDSLYDTRDPVNDIYGGFLARIEPKS